MSADRSTWFVFNASPDIRQQIEAFPPLRTQEARTTPLAAVLLTDAELDHTLGLLLLRESEALELHATPAVRDALRTGSGLLRILEAYCVLDWQPVVPEVAVKLHDGLSYVAFDVPTTKLARFGADGPGRVVGYRISDERTGRSLAYVPGMQELTPAIRERLTGCACVLIDGTCWRDDELSRLGLASKTSRAMGHLPISGHGGSLEQLARLRIDRGIYVHLNNTNPVLLEDGPERAQVEKYGIEVAEDGLELEV